MRTQEIPRHEWRPFLEAFSVRNRHRLATVRVLRDQLGAQVEVRDRPFQALFFEARDDAMTMVMGADADAPMEHPVRVPQRLWLEFGETGTEAALQIESGDGTRTILEFRPAPRTEAARDETP